MKPSSHPRTALLLALWLTTALAAPAQIFKTLVTFDDSDGASPNFMLQGRDGKLWGTTFGSGPTFCGTAFEMSRTGAFNNALTFNCNTNFPDGDEPQGLIQGSDGNFYGVTGFGGSNENGSVFKLTPNGVFTTLVSFNVTNGSGPVGMLTEGTDGDFYGATYGGGESGWGTLFKVTPTGTLTTLYQFDFTHGAQPYAGVVLGTDGNFYGVTYSGGAWGVGTFYRITLKGMFTVIYSFGEYSNDPSSPVTPVVQARDGNFYGVTSFGGTSNDGTVFKLTPKGAFTTVYEFSGTDGYGPIGPLAQASDGSLYGVTGGSTNGRGTVFKLTPGGMLKTLHNFTGPDGALPVALLQDTNGKFYGLTSQGGTSSEGTVFRLDTHLGPFVTLLPYSGPVGDTIDVLGQGFTSTTTVSFNGTPAAATVKSGTFLTAIVPSGATSGFVTVTTPGGTLTSNKKFIVLP